MCGIEIVLYLFKNCIFLSSIALVNFLSSAIKTLVLLCACGDVSDYFNMLQYLTINAVVKNVHAELSSREIIFVGRVA